MKIRLGYVAISNKLGRKVTSSSTVTYTNYCKLKTPEEKLKKLTDVTLSNLSDLIKLLEYNIENNIHFYRITSSLIPLVTHPEVGYWGHREIFKNDFKYIGKIIKNSSMRVDTHPDQFNVLNSTNPLVVKNTIVNLMRQAEWFQDMGYKDWKMVLHIGGAPDGKENGLERFAVAFKALPQILKGNIIVENDDKIYNAVDTLKLCKALSIPMVLDVHHHNCNNDGIPLESFLDEIFTTWQKQKLPPKFHFSSPLNGEKVRKHADFIVAEDFINFIEKTRSINKDFDVMLECKEKDVALFKLVEDIKLIKPQYKWIDETTFII
ncbi:UV-damage endonuclease [Hathewaya proteolytica DSM 3090]|uniref:UV-damage endonuclease n=1 Tax=Hathewaya proteolytica DSM 3090 TaxID=1121331 RepID=A0A1M6K8Y6_9CLOT|nr:UV DNA damage repair endonuclease UvsE [Hathewaya proteolytica]SHJ55409.1 UV-damage endonuclease [Hathewaya proteolytica DSM 3090]